MKYYTPVILFTYIRTETLTETLKCLKENKVPLIYAFSDGPRTPDNAPAVKKVREILHNIDWCEIIIFERDINLGLGQSIITGVTEILKKHESVIIFEDDLICVPGTYQYLNAALDYYKNNPEVMSITGWTHPSVTPSDIIDQPYFDGRAECWVWGTWARAWSGMLDYDALTLVRKCEMKGIDVYQYGVDLVNMAKLEKQMNIWAVRFLYWHIFNRGLCLRPPWSMVNSIGFSEEATNTKQEDPWLKIHSLRECPIIPDQWPKIIENSECSALWRKILGQNHNKQKNRLEFLKTILDNKMLRSI